MASVDKRIVEMKFNNAAFERGVAKTMQTIRGLKNALKFDGASKGLKDIEASAGKVNFSGIEKSLETISNRFSTFGIIGAAALQKITHTAIETGQRIASAITEPLVEGGKKRALNIEQAKFQFEGLGIDVEKAMASALEAVSGTAYGLDSAARVASQFGASGMVAGKEMTQSLRAVAGVAAMTGSEYDDIGMIFTQVAGQGRLMGDQLLQLSGRGINAAATLGKALGKSEKEVRELVSDGKISFETFYKAMDEAFGTHAKDANKTFTGAFANMKAAISRIGADIATPAFRSLRNIFNTLTPVIDNIHAALGPLTNSIVKTMKAAERMTKTFLKGIEPKDITNIGKALNNLYKAAGNVFKGISSVIKPIKEGLKEALPPATTKGFLNFANALKQLTSNLKVTGSAIEALKNVGRGLGNIFTSIVNVFKAVASFLKPIKEAIVETIEPFKESIKNLLPGSLSETFVKITESLKDFTAGLKLSDEQSEKVKVVFKGLFTVIGAMLKPIGSLGGVVKKVLNPAFKLLGAVLKGAGVSIKSVAKLTVDMLAAGINPLAKGIAYIIPKVVSFAKSFADVISKSKVFQDAMQKVKDLISRITDAFATSTTKVGGFSNAMKMIGKVLLTSAAKGLQVVIDLVKDILNSLGGIVSGFGDVASGIGEGIRSILNGIGDMMEKLLGSAVKTVDGVIDILGKIIENLGDKLSIFVSDLPKTVGEIGPWLSKILVNTVKSIGTLFVTIVDGAIVFVREFINAIKFMGEKIGPIISSTVIKMGTAFSNGLKTIISLVGAFISEIAAKIAKVGPVLIASIAKSTSEMGKAVSIALQEIIEHALAFVGEMILVGAQVMPGIIQGINDGISAMGNKLSVYFDNILKNIDEFVEECRDSASKIGSEIGKGVSKGLEETAGSTATVLKTLINTVREFSSEVSKGIGNGITKITEYLSELKKKLSEMAKAFKDAALEKISPTLESIGEKFEFIITPAKNAGKAINGVLDSMKERLESAKKAYEQFFNIVKTVFGKVVTFLKPVGDTIKDIFAGVNITDVLNTASLIGVIKIFQNLSKSLGGIGTSFKKLLGSMSGAFGSVSSTLNEVKKSLEGYQNTLKAKTLKEIAVAVAILAGSIALLSLIKPSEIAAGLGAVTVLLGEVIGTLAILNKMDLDSKKINRVAISMDLVAISITLLAGALRKLEGFDTMKSIAAPLTAMSTMIAEITGAMVVLIKTVEKSDADNLGTDMIKLSISMVVISAAISKLASACQKLGSMDTNQLKQGSIAIGALLSALVLFAALSKGRELDKVASTLTAISISMLLLQKSVEKLGSMNFNTMATGLRRVVELMAVMVASMKLINGVNVKGAASSILALAAAMNMLIIPVLAFGSMNLGTLAQGLIAIGIAMAEMVAAVNAMPSDSTKGAGAMIAMATALTILSVPIMLLGSMPLGSLVAGLVAVGVALAGLSAVLVVLAPLGTSLVVVAGAFALFGGAIALVGAGVLAFAVGLTTLAASATVAVAGLMTFLAAIPMITAEFELAIAAIAAAAPAIGSSFETIGDVVIRTISHLLQTLVTELVKVVAQFAKEIGKQAPTFVKMGVDIIKALLKGVQQVIPEVVKTGVTLIKNVLKGVQQVIPEVVKTGVTFVKNFLKGVQQVIGDIVDTGVEIVKSLLKGIRDLFPDIIKTGFDLIKEFLKGIRDNIKDIVTIAADAVTNFIDGIASKIGDIIDSAMNLAISFIEGLADGIDNNKERFVEAITHLFESVIDLIIELITKGIPKLLKKAVELGKAFLEGVKDILPKLPGMALDLVVKLANGIIDAVPKIASAAGDLIRGFVKGVTKGLSAVADAAKKVAGAAVDTVKKFLGIHSPSKVFKDIGLNVVQGFVLGVKGNVHMIIDVVSMMTQPFTQTMNQIIKNMSYGQGVVNAFYKNFVKGTKNIEAGNKALVNMGNAVQNFAYQLYLASDLYKEDMKNQKARAKEYDKAVKQVKKAEEEVAKARKKSAESTKKANVKVATSTKKTAKTVKKSNDESTESTKKATKSVNDYSNAMAGAAKSSKKFLTAKEQFAADQGKGIGDGDSDSDKKKKKTSSKSKTSSNSEAKKAATEAKKKAEQDKKDLKEAEKALKEAKKNQEKIDKEIAKEAETVAKHIKQVYNELRSTLIEGVKSFLDPLSMSLDSGIDIFSEFNTEYELTSKQLLDNMRSQNEGVRAWNDQLAILMQRGLDEGIIEKLREAGPQSAEQVHAFMQMTTDELKLANKEWEDANKLTAETVLKNQKDALIAAQEWADGITELAKRGLNKDLLKQLGDAGVGSAEYVKAYLSMTPSQIDELNASYKEYLSIPNDIADQVIASYVVAGDKSFDGFINSATGNTSSGKAKKKKAKKEMRDMVIPDEKIVDDSKDKGDKIVEAFTEGVKRGSKDLKRVTTNMSDATYDALKKTFNKDTGKDLGKDVTDGVSDGLKDGTKDVKDSAKETGKAAVDGVSDGMSEEAKKLQENITNFISTVSDGVKSFISPLSQSLDSGIDIFKEFENEFELTSEQILKNMSSQNAGVRQWKLDLEALVRKGLDEGLVRQLRAAGPQAAEEVHALMEMPIAELQNVNAQWMLANKLSAETVLENQRDALAQMKEWQAGIIELAERGLNKDLLKELSEAGVGSSEYVKAYLEMTPDQVAEVNSSYEEISVIPNRVATVLAGTVGVIKNTFVDGIIPTEEDIERAGQGYTDAVTKVWNSVGYQGKIAGSGASNEIADGITETTPKITAAADTLGNLTRSSVEHHLNADRAKELSVKFAEGVSSGIQSGATKMSNEATKSMNGAVNEATIASTEGMANAGAQATTAYTENVITIGNSNSPERKEIKDTYVETTTYVGEATQKEAKYQGEQTITSLSNGALSKEGVVRGSFTQIGNAAFQSLRAFLNHDIGVSLATNIVEGIIIGFKNNEGLIQNEARSVALKALAAAKAALGIASPSKEFIKVGEYSTEGMVIGLKNHKEDVINAGNDVGNSLLEAMKVSANKINSALNDDISGSPVITPVIDLSNVFQASKDIDASLSKSLAMRLAAETYMNTPKSGNVSRGKETKDTTQTKSQNFNFIQNNYSPKELSRVDIYRDTKSQFAQFKKEVQRA